MRIGAGFGPGLSRGFGSPKYRGLLSVEWAPQPDEKPPLVVKPLDRDKDGVIDAQDACPDVPGVPIYGLEHQDQPVFASDVVRYVGEPLAVVAADHPETARRAVDAIFVDYEVLAPLIDPEAAFTADPIHPAGNLFRHVRIRHGDADATGDVVVEGEYEVGMQDQAFLGPESGLAIPTEDGGVELACAPAWEASNYAAQAHDPWKAVRQVTAPGQTRSRHSGPRRRRRGTAPRRSRGRTFLRWRRCRRR